MDTMEWTKIVGGLCGSLLVFLLIQWGTESIYHGSDHTDHGEHYASQKLDNNSETTELDESTEIPFIELVMNGDSSTLDNSSFDSAAQMNPTGIPIISAGLTMPSFTI